MTTQRRWLTPLLIVVTAIVGALTALQSRVNGSLAEYTGSALVASMISFGIGLILLLLFLVRKDTRAGFGRILRSIRMRELPWWGLLGGACGAFTILNQAWAVPYIGVAVFTTAIVVGQLFGASAIDHFGLVGAPKHRFTWLRGVGGALALAAVALVGMSGEVSWQTVWLSVLAIAAGFGIALQLGITGTVKHHAGEAVSPAVLNFTIGFVLLVVVTGIAALFGGVEFHGLPTDWWMYLGGPIGVLFILLVAVVARRLGVFVLSMTIVAGQLTGSLVLDLLEQRVTWMLLVGVPLAFVGILIAHLGARR
ncbi:DMT family transporter [Gulosibacter molinativorax]|uniref:EamA-like transporter family protein n=1 Tax=Gulosibacter molinativorax TaxID=256821 RepID=A0ABT7C8N8_9MICO|nr:DMT family transporter [Gulosibacter molinativorax]MDJ1371460.1 EamA-like transporter family protein [Gulosibacter molinativorax]QUY62958.1 Hypothetical protein GMOLON4_2270 [Gulosibacter molinativorax]